MPKGPSGRVVIELDTEFKDELYSALEKEGLNMKQWFVSTASEFLKNRSQLNLQLISADKVSIKEGVDLDHEAI